jgi:hypothetical protein
MLADSGSRISEQNIDYSINYSWVAELVQKVGEFGESEAPHAEPDLDCAKDPSLRR